MAGQETSEPIRRVLILISDGDDNASHVTSDMALQSMLRDGIALEAVDTMGDNAAFVTLRKLAIATGGNVWMGGRPKELAKSLAKIEASLRSQYFVAYRPSGELAKGQFRKIQVKPVGHKGRMAYRTGYFVP
jgi:VWFA-related protein